MIRRDLETVAQKVMPTGGKQPTDVTLQVRVTLRKEGRARTAEAAWIVEVGWIVEAARIEGAKEIFNRTYLFCRLRFGYQRLQHILLADNSDDFAAVYDGQGVIFFVDH